MSVRLNDLLKLTQVYLHIYWIVFLILVFLVYFVLIVFLNVMSKEAVAIYVLAESAEDLQRPVTVDFSAVIFDDKLVALEFDVVQETVVDRHSDLAFAVNCQHKHPRSF